MADINQGKKPKYLLRMGVWYFKKKYNESSKTDIKTDMENCGNPIIRKIYNIIKKDSEKIETIYHKNIIDDFSELGLWVMYKDTAYRQFFFYTLKHILENKDEFMKLLEEYYVEPEEWYMNRWKKAVYNTLGKKENGTITNTDMSYDEKIFVPEYQHQKFDSIYKDKLDEMIREMEIEKKKKGLI